MEDHRSEGFLEQQVEPLHPSERFPAFLRRYTIYATFGETNFQIKYRLGAIFRSLLLGLFSIPLYTANTNTVPTMANLPKGSDAKPMGLKPQHAVAIAGLPKTSVHQRVIENSYLPNISGMEDHRSDTCTALRTL
jgi:hypothetical protein